jgi:hypothetical protein
MLRTQIEMERIDNSHKLSYSLKQQKKKFKAQMSKLKSKHRREIGCLEDSV